MSSAKLWQQEEQGGTHRSTKGCLQMRGTLKQPQPHKKMLPRGGGPQAPAPTLRLKIRVWGKSLQGLHRVKSSGGRTVGAWLHRSCSERATLKRCHQAHRKAKIQQQRAAHPLSECDRTLAAPCLWAVRRQTKELSSASQGNADKSSIKLVPHTDSSACLQQSLTAACLPLL